MPVHFFDILDGNLIIDEIGTECRDIEEVRFQARKVLPEIAREVLPENEDHHTIRVIVRDEANEVVYTATLIFSGQIMQNRSREM